MRTFPFSRTCFRLAMCENSQSHPWDRIVPIEAVDPALVPSFSCGDEPMDTWFLSKAANWCYLGLCQVYAAVDDLGIVGFFSLSPTSIAPRSLTASLRHGKNAMEHPGILLGRIAVRLDLQRTSQRVGTSLLHHAVKRSVRYRRYGWGQVCCSGRKERRTCVLVCASSVSPAQR